MSRPLLLCLLCLLPLPAVSGPAPGPELTLNGAQLDWIGGQIFRNECAARIPCLVHWNPGEGFPSLGIGHFIWYPAGFDGPFTESFPALIGFLSSRSVTLPPWLESLAPLDAPWPDRDAFLAAGDSEQVQSLRRLLADTRGLQAEFMFQRARASLERVIAAAPEAEREQVRERILALSRSPGGVYALIDYVNFKGEGLAPRETYRGQGWGLLQVLLQMRPHSGDATALDRFREAAALVLTRRADNAPDAGERQRWLPGWLQRLQTYRHDALSIPVGPVN